MHSLCHLFRMAALFTASASATHAGPWDGYYVGGVLGGGAGTYELGVSSMDQVGPDVDADGAILGVRAGRNYSSGNLVYGYDFEATNGPSGTTPIGTAAPDFECGTGECNVSINAIISARARVGKLFDPQTMIYGAAGLAVGDVEGGIANSGQQGSSTATGFTIGLGLERQIRDSLTAFGEVAHYDLGALEFGENVGIAFDQAFDGVGTFATIKVGVMYSF